MLSPVKVRRKLGSIAETRSLLRPQLQRTCSSVSLNLRKPGARIFLKKDERSTACDNALKDLPVWFTAFWFGGTRLEV